MLGCLFASGCSASAASAARGPSAQSVPLDGLVCSSGEAAGPSRLAIARVIVRGASDRSACAVVRSIAGRAENARVVESDIEALFATGAYDDVVVVREHDDGGIDLVFELKERRRVGRVSLDGITSEAASAALAGFALETPERVDPAWLRRAERRLREELESVGFSRATVQAAVQAPSGAPDASVRFLIDEGPQTVLTRVSITGLRVANEKTLREALYLRAGAPAPPSLIERDAIVVEVTLKDFGLLAATVEKRVVASEDGTGLDVSFQVKEGPVYHLRKVAVSGDAQLEAKAYAPLLALLKPGSVFSRKTVQDIETKMEALHSASSATARVDVDPKVDFVSGTTDVNVTFEVTVR
jgi:outer membrane protein insertion porin family